MNTKFIQKAVILIMVVAMWGTAIPLTYAQSNMGPGVDLGPSENNNFAGPGVDLSPANNNVDPVIPVPSQPGIKAETPLESLQKSLNQSNSGLNGFDGRFHPLSAVDPGADVLTSIVFTVIDFMKYFLGIAATLFATIQGIKLVTAGKKIDEIQPKALTALKLMLYGFIIIIIADELVLSLYGEYGECAASASNAKECAKAGSAIVKGIYDFILSILAALAIVSIAFAGFRMVTAAGDDEAVSSSKKRIGIAVAGLIVAGIGEYVVKGIVFPNNGEKGIDYAAAQQLVISFTNYISSFIGIGAFIMLFYGGYLYAASFGDDDKIGKAKNVIKSALIGILIAAAAFAIIRTITSFEARSDLNLPRNIPGVTDN